MVYKGALVGFGRAGAEVHLPAWKRASGFEMAAVVDRNPERLALARKLQPGVRTYHRVEELLGHESLDFLDICTIPADHGPLTLTALEHGLHVLCEKPLTLSLAEFQAITTRAQDRAVFTAHTWKYSPLFQRVRALVEKGALGQPRYFALQTLRQGPAQGFASGQGNWRLVPEVAGGGILVDHGWHAFSLAVSLMGRPLAVSAQLHRLQFREAQVEDTAHCLVEFPQGLAQITLSWAAACRRTQGLLLGTTGWLEIGDQRLVLQAEGRREELNFPEALSAASYHLDWFLAMLEDFRLALLEPNPRHTNLEEARLCLLLTHLAYDSHQHHGQWRALPSG